MTIFNPLSHPVNLRSLTKNTTSGQAAVQIARGTFVTERDLGKILPSRTKRASGKASRSKTPKISYSFTTTASFTLGVGLIDKTSVDSSGQRIFNFQRVNLFNDDTGRKVTTTGGSLTNNRFGFQTPITPGTYVLKFSPRGSKTLDYSLVLRSGLES